VRMKHQTDKKRSKRQFQVGDLVLLKLQPYVQFSLAPHANQKLAFMYFGLFPVLQCIGKVAYKLGLPQSSTIHPIFHVSQLKPAVGASVAEVSSSLPSNAEDLHMPKRILQKRDTLIFSGQKLVESSDEFSTNLELLKITYRINCK
jgi:hypothetical protein